MKIKFLLSALLFSVFFISCKDNESEKKDSSKSVEVKHDDVFKVTFKYKIKKDDNFCLYYTYDGTINFNDKQTIWMPVKGSDAEQTVTFLLPESIVPSYFRVDFGSGKNIEQSDVELKSFDMVYNGKSFKAENTDILNYFTPFEPYTKIAPNTSTLQRLKKDQEGGPILYPIEKLMGEINKISNGASPE